MWKGQNGTCYILISSFTVISYISTVSVTMFDIYFKHYIDTVYFQYIYNKYISKTNAFSKSTELSVVKIKFKTLWVCEPNSALFRTKTADADAFHCNFNSTTQTSPKLI